MQDEFCSYVGRLNPQPISAKSCIAAGPEGQQQRWSYKGEFLVSSERIADAVKRNEIPLNELFNELQKNDQVPAIHYLERLWGPLFQLGQC